MLNHRLRINAALVATALPLLLATVAVAAPPKAAKPANKPVKKEAAMYECAKCHMKVTAAVAKKDKFKDPMDGGTFAPVKPAVKKSSSPMGKMGKM